MEPFDPLHPDVLADPFPTYARLRREAPVHRHDGLDAWVVTTYEDCATILAEPDLYSCDFRVIGEETPEEFLSLQTLDGPEQGRLRRSIVAALRGIDMPGWIGETEATAHKILAGRDFSAPGGPDGAQTLDFVVEFAEPLAALSMCSLFGVPLLEDEQAFRAAQRDLVLSMDSGLAPDRRDAGMRARRRLSDLIEPWTRRPPADGLLSRVDYASAADLRAYLVNSLRAIFVAGYSSTGSMLGNAMKVLLAHGLLAGDEPLEITPTAYHELVRHEGAVQAISRAVTGPTRLRHGPELAHGDVVVAMVAAANRDPAVFADADALRLDRDPNPHLGFGRGIHSCAGTRLALAVGVRVLTSLSAKYRVEPAGSPVQRPTATIRGLDHLPVRLTPR